MNSTHIINLNNNSHFKKIINSIRSNNQLSLDLVNFGNFLDKGNDIVMGKLFVNSDNKLNRLSEQFTDIGIDKIKSGIYVNKNIIHKPINLYSSQMIIKSIFDNNKYILTLNKVLHYKYSENLIYIVLYSLFPNILNYQKRTDYLINKVKEELLFSLNEKQIFEKNDYKKIISKTSFQNKLIEYPSIDIPFHIMVSFLSDYFNINIIVLVENLIIKNYHFNDKQLVLLLFYKNNSFYIISNNDINLIENKIYQEIEETMTSKYEYIPINKLNKLCNYKSRDLHKLGILLGLQNDILTKKIKKEDLYNMITELLPKF